MLLLTVRADSKDLQIMAHRFEAVLGSDFFVDLLFHRAQKLNGAATLHAHEVMMVRTLVGMLKAGGAVMKLSLIHI